MKIEFPALHSDALVYFLFHSGVFVLVLAVTFLAMGLGLGRALWGRYKRRAQVLTKETEAQKSEISDLKRKLAEMALRPMPAIEPVPAPVQVTPPPPAPILSPAPAPFSAAPDRVIEDVPAMPELAPAFTPMEAPPKPVVRPPRPKPAVLAATPRPSRGEAAIAPFSFLMDEPEHEPPDSES